LIPRTIRCAILAGGAEVKAVRVLVAETKKEKSNQVAKTQVHVADKFQQSTTLTAVPKNQDPSPAWTMQAK
jgi:hypothetical protein